MKQPAKNNLLILLFIIIVMIFFGIGSVPLLDPDEPVYAETAREMVAAGDLISPRIYGAFWYDKPPFYYWLVALAQNIFANWESAARFPSGIMAAATSIMLYFSLRKLLNETTAFWSALVLTTSVEIFYLAKAAVTDTSLLFFLTAALLAFLHKKYWLIYPAMALATLVKGPIGLIFPVSIICFYLLLTKQLRELLRMHILPGLLLYLLIAAPWYYAMYSLHGNEFFQTFFGIHNYTRFLTAEHASRVSFWYYLPVLIIGFFPWSGILLPALKSSLRDSCTEEKTILFFMHVWWLFVFIFFTICKTKLVSYLLPLFPALAVLVGWYLSQLVNTEKRSKFFSVCLYLDVLIFLGVGIGWLIGGQLLPEAMLSGSLLGLLTIFLGLVVLYVISKSQKIQIFGALHIFTGFITMLLGFGFILPTVADRFSTKTMASYYCANCNSTMPVHVDKFLRPGFMFYAGKAGTALKPKTDDFQRALADGQSKYILVRGLEYRRYLKEQAQHPNLRVLYQKGDIYLLQQD